MSLHYHICEVPEWPMGVAFSQWYVLSLVHAYPIIELSNNYSEQSCGSANAWRTMSRPWKLIQSLSTPFFAWLPPLSFRSITTRTAAFPANCLPAQYCGQGHATERPICSACWQCFISHSHSSFPLWCLTPALILFPIYLVYLGAKWKMAEHHK